MTTYTRVALVTGGAQGIGEGIAVRLAEDGLDVAILDVKGKEDKLEAVAKKITATGRRSFWLVSDVSSEEAVRLAVDEVVAALGSLDVMVANAGIAILNTLIETSLEEFNKVLAVNAGGVMLCYKYAALQMIKQGRGGRILGACSTAGLQAPTGLLAYSASKFAIRGMTQASSRELQSYNITVNAYAPGLIRTDMTAHPDDTVNGGHGSVLMKTLGTPGWRAADPCDIAGLVSYLVKPEAWFITGQTISIDGGNNCN